MTDPKVAAKFPKVMDLEPGRYAWCRCGRSGEQPFCDGSHGGTGMAPLVFEVEEARSVALCQCKQTGGEPFCDGTHSGLA